MGSLIKTIIGYPLHLLKGIVQALAVVLFLLTTAFLVMSFYGEGIGPGHNWANIFDLFSHLRLQILLAQLIVFVIFIVLRDKPWLIATVVALVFNLKDIVPYYIPQNKPFSAEAGSLKVLQWNVYKENSEFKPLLTYIKQSNPDVIGLEEVDQKWLIALNTPLRAYPYRMMIPQDNNFGIALYSKFPLVNQQVHYFGAHKPKQPASSQPFDPQALALKLWNQIFPPDQFPSLSAIVRYRGHPITIIVTHPMPPLSGFEMRNDQLSDMAVFAGRQKMPVIVMGDMNCSQWSVYFQKLLRNASLVDSQMGYGIQPSWPNLEYGPTRTGFHKKIPSFLTPFFQMPIDHVLVSPQFIILKRQMGPAATNSDHLPIFVEMALDPKLNQI
jgi:endonuclease/exonuclease/phosphatase (EEP) superfamily protein YafD